MTRQQQYLLVCLIEEAGETIQAATKALRFGLYGRDPRVQNSETNGAALRREVNDLQVVIETLGAVGIDLSYDQELADLKAARIQRRLREYMGGV